MKKLFFTLMGIAAVAAVACQPKEEAEIANGHRISVTLTAAQPETKTYIEEVQGGWQPYWSADDAIVVTNTADFETESPKDNPFVNQSGAGINASFTGSIVAEDGEVTVHAYRPKRANRSKGIFKFAIPATQAVPSLTTFNPDYDLLVADPLTLTVANQTVTSADPLHFHRLVSVVRIIAKDNTKAGAIAGKSIKSARFTADGVTLCGELGVDIKAIQVEKWYDKATPIASYVEATYEGTDWTADGTTGAYVLTGPATIPAGTSISLKLTLSDGSEVTASRITKEEIKLESAKVVTLKFQILDNDLNAEETESVIWDFSTSGWQAEFAKLGSAATELAAVEFTYAGLTIKGDAKSKYNTTYWQTTGVGSTSANYFKFTASEAGLVTVNESHTGSSAPDPLRYICVFNNGEEQQIEGSVNSKAPKNCRFNVEAGDVYVYGTGGARYYTIKFEAGKSVEPADPDNPSTDPADEGGELEIPESEKPATSTVDPTKMYGYAQAAGVTGGEGASAVNTLHFDNGKALQTWLLARAKSEKKGDTSPVIIWLSGTFGPEDGRDFSEAHPWFDVKEVSNLSFYGTDGFVMDRIGMFLVRSSNIIIRNINFQQPKANNGADAVSMQEADGVWVDHCTFTSLNQTKDYEDGSTDVTHGSKNVTVSWCRYIKTQKSCLVGHSNSQTTDTQITATFHHNWFDGSSSRHPRVRFGNVHVYNNLFDGCTTYGVGSAYGAKVLVEYNYFDGVQLPTDICSYPAKENGESNLTGSVAGYLYAAEDILLNRPAKAKDPYPLTNVKYKAYKGETLATPLTYADFKPAYDYTVTPAADVPEVVKANAGYGKLGWTEAPVAVNNGGITDFNGTDDNPTDPDPGQGETPAGFSDGWNWLNNSAATATYAIADGKLTIQATGKWEGSGQAFGYAYRDVTGDFTATVKIDSYTNAKGADNNQGVAGLMMAASDPAGTGNNLIFVLSGKSEKFYRRYRSSNANSSSSEMKAPETAGSDVVVRIVREGNVFKCSYSLDGGATFGGASTLDTFADVPETVKIGVAANSADNSKTATAVFSNFTLSGEAVAF